MLLAIEQWEYVMNKVVKSFCAAALLATGVTGLGVVPVSAKEADLEGKVMPDGEKIICRRVQETGSLVKKSKKCYTKKQWDRVAEAAKTNATRMQSDHAAGMVSN
jgi:hypothetical protein